ncbi:hypothetical protein PanWU01x14_278850 [Parasponia andersonii]|uniref:Uncharacterized protein n=1 Tax=Parasponia andersonii TaxID=3476 RepID=A0A2P5B225_PARAD|nr:hypothetical protein PanWU01x14_278850 [Parasponia andersonii]
MGSGIVKPILKLGSRYRHHRFYWCRCNDRFYGNSSRYCLVICSVLRNLRRVFVMIISSDFQWAERNAGSPDGEWVLRM